MDPRSQRAAVEPAAAGRLGAGPADDRDGGGAVSLGAAGVWSGGPQAIGWRLQAVERFGLFPELLRYSGRPAAIRWTS